MFLLASFRCFELLSIFLLNHFGFLLLFSCQGSFIFLGFSSSLFFSELLALFSIFELEHVVDLGDPVGHEALAYVLHSIFGIHSVQIFLQFAHVTLKVKIYGVQVSGTVGGLSNLLGYLLTVLFELTESSLVVAFQHVQCLLSVFVLDFHLFLSDVGLNLLYFSFDVFSFWLERRHLKLILEVRQRVLFEVVHGVVNVAIFEGTIYQMNLLIDVLLGLLQGSGCFVGHDFGPGCQRIRLLVSVHLADVDREQVCQNPTSDRL